MRSDITIAPESARVRGARPAVSIWDAVCAVQPPGGEYSYGGVKTLGKNAAAQASSVCNASSTL